MPCPDVAPVSAHAASNRAERLERLVVTAFGLDGPERVPFKLGLRPGRYAELRRFLATGEAPEQGLASELARLHDALSAVGLRERYLDVLDGVAFPLEWSGAVWERRLGPTDAGREGLHAALVRVGWERHGLVLRRHVAIGGEAVEWGIAGLLPTGRAVKLAIAVREAPTPLSALAEDLADDAVAEAGFALLGFRDWQLARPEACARHVVEAVQAAAPALSWPLPVVDDQDAALAQPQQLTPRERCPHWSLRQALRRAQPQLSRSQLLARYRALVIDRTVESAEEGEWSVLGG